MALSFEKLQEDLFGEDAYSNDGGGSSGEDWDVQVDQHPDDKGQQTPATSTSPAPAAPAAAGLRRGAQSEEDEWPPCPLRLPVGSAADQGATAITAVATRGDPREDEGESKDGATASHESAPGSGPRKTAPMTNPRDELSTIYDALGGERWAEQERWNLDGPLCDCKGVTLDERGQVVRIDLKRCYGVKGDISKAYWPASLLSLSLGPITGPITGDLSKVQWPAALQKLDLGSCCGIKGDLSRVQWPAALRELDLQYCYRVEGDLSKIQWPAWLQTLKLQYTKVSGDLSKVQWPAALDKLNLDYCKQVSGDLSRVQWPEGLTELWLGDTEISGDLSEAKWPASLQKLDLSRCGRIKGDLSKVQWRPQRREQVPRYIAFSLFVLALAAVAYYCFSRNFPQQQLSMKDADL